MGSQIYPNIWLWVKFIKEEDFQLSVKYEQIKNDTYKGRNRTNEVRKDNQILNAKVKYLESIKDNKAIDDFLTLLREICPKPTFLIKLFHWIILLHNYYFIFFILINKIL
jgi:hypothetical protein